MKLIATADMTTWIYMAVSYVLTSIGLWQLFKKCQIKKVYALIPYYRTYKLADFLDMEDDGSSYFTISVFMIIADVASTICSIYLNQHKHTVYFLMIFDFILMIITFFYRFRIQIELVRNFHRKFAWTFLWAFLDSIMALVWGFSGKFQPTLSEEEGQAAAASGLVAKNTGKGLNVNIKARKVRAGGIKYRYLLRDIHLNIEPGKMVLLLGGSGAGKTTFLNAINGYEPAEAKIRLDGADVYKNYDRLKYRIGFVPQQDLIRYQDTVEQTVKDAAKLRLPKNMSRAERQQRVHEVMELFGLLPVAKNMVGKQSGGQKKRISIATEFVSDPDLFILDEPDSGLDGILARELMQRLNDISRTGKIVIVITHTPDRVIDLFDEVIVLGKDADRTGRLVFHGPIEEAKTFFGVNRMEEIVRKINRVEEGGEGMADMLIEKYAEVCHDEE